MEQCIYRDTLKRIQKEEQSIKLDAVNVIEESYRMVIVLRALLNELKIHVLQHGFLDINKEIEFFKHIKPQLLGKLVFYNKVSRIETSCPVSAGNLLQAYYSDHLNILKQEFKEHIGMSEFYRYYRSGRTDKDDIYFRLGNINFYEGLNSFVFEIDEQFSTFYDYKIARIIANELLYAYLHLKVEPYDFYRTNLSDFAFEKNDFHWIETKNALIELIYALHASASIAHQGKGRIGLRKLSLLFQEIFDIELGDVHHAFHRMKDRTGDRTAFLSYLKECLEQYMNKNL